MPEETAPTPVEKATKRNYKPMAIITAIGAVGVAIVALNTFTGLNFRPAWAYETEMLETADEKLAAADIQIQQRLDKVLQIHL